MAGLSQAQDIRGTISGTVTDPQGAQVVGATVIVTNTDTNVVDVADHERQRLIMKRLRSCLARTR